MRSPTALVTAEVGRARLEFFRYSRPCRALSLLLERVPRYVERVRETAAKSALPEHDVDPMGRF